MKTKILATALPVLLLVAASLNSSAQIIITGTAEPGTVTQLPGSPTDFEFFSATSSGPTAVLDDFTVNYSTNNNGYGSTLISPLGDEVNTEAIYTFGTYYNNGITAGEVLQFTLGSSPTFNYSNFNMYVLYGNAGSTVFDTSSLILTPNDYTGGTSDSISTIGGTQVDVTESSDGPGGTAGQIVEFTVTNASPDETFSLLATASEFADVEAISFSPATAPTVPEPGTWALMLAGLICLIGLQRQRFARK